MVCPFCLHKKTEIYNSRQGARLNSTWRRRRCLQCGAQFTTYESADPSSILAVKDGKQIKPFSHSKLLIQLFRACDHRHDLDEAAPYLASTIEQKLYKLATPVLSKEVIIETISDTLKNYDPVAYVKYIGQHSPLSAATIRKELKRQK